MSLISIWARVCPHCRHDSSRLEPFGIDLHRVRCGNDHCGGVGMVGATEGAAVVYWNQMPVRRGGLA